MLARDQSRWALAFVFARRLLSVSALATVQALAQGPDLQPQQVPRLDYQELSSPPINRSETVTRFAFGSCYKAQLSQDQVWQSIASTEPQFFIFAGDTVYPKSDDETGALTQLRHAYGMLQNEPAFAKLRAQVPVLAVWDDHDYGKNDGGGDFAWRAESEQLFESAWAQQADEPRRGRPGVYFSETLGKAGKKLQLIVLDTRFFRSPLRGSNDYGSKGTERYIPDSDTRKTMLGEAQWLWLETQLQVPADLRIIVSTVQVLADGHGWEGWKQLPRERERLFALLRAKDTAPVVLLSGDRHVAGFYERDVGLSTPLLEFTSSALNNPIAFPNRYKTLAEDGPHRLGPLFGEANFGSVAIDWKAGVIELNLHDARGAVVRTVLRNLSR